MADEQLVDEWVERCEAVSRHLAAFRTDLPRRDRYAVVVALRKRGHSMDHISMMTSYSRGRIWYIVTQHAAQQEAP